MASFVERATLIVDDKSSQKLSKVERAVKSLTKSAQKAQKTLPKIKIAISAAEISRIDRAARALERLSAASRTMRGNSVSARFNGNTRAVQAHTRALRELSAAQRQVSGGAAIRPTSVPSVGRRAVGGFDHNVAGEGLARTFLRVAAYSFAFQVQSAVAQGIKQGFTERDVGDTRLALQKLSANQQSGVQSVATQIARDGTGVLSRGAAAGLIAEVIPVVRGDVDLAGKMVASLDRVIALQVAQGETVENAVESAINIAKVSEQTGRLTDASGNFDDVGFTKFATLLTGAMAQGGKEITAQLVRGITKSLRTSKLTLDDRGFLAALAIGEEVGTTAGVGINQLIKQLTGERIKKKQLNQLADFGLIGLKEVRSGTVGSSKRTTTVADGTVDERLLRENPVAWIRKNVIPVMRREGFDPNDTVDAAKFAGLITSDRTATEALTQMIIRNEELRTWIDSALKLQQSAPELQAINDASGLVSMSSARAQLVSALGETANAFESVLIPAMNGVASIAERIAAFVAGPDGQGSLRNGAAAIALGGLGIAGGVQAGKGLLSSFSGLPANTTAVSANTAALNRLTALMGGTGTGKGKGKKSAAKRIGLGASAGALGAAIALPEIADFSKSAGTALGEFIGKRVLGRSDQEQAAATAAAQAANEQNAKAISGFIGSLFGSGQEVKTAALQSQASVSEIKNEIALISQEIANRKQALPDPAHATDFKLGMLSEERAQLQAELNTLQASMGQHSQSLTSVFNQGAEQMRQIGPTITNAAEQFGPRAGAGMMPFATQFGNAAGEAAASRLSGVTIGIRSPNAGANTGANVALEGAG